MSMTIRKTSITVRELVAGYVNETENDIEKAVMAYDGKLCVRPAFQRSFVYDKKQENAVIDTVLKGFPLNIMYWVDNGDGTYDCLDGQQRTISLCNFADNITSYKGNAPLAHDASAKATYISTLERWGDADKFYDYELEVYICKGSKAEQLEWFRVINIAGEKLYDQELRNASYVSSWLTDAKRYFSKADGNAKCPAERIAEGYTNKNANRQEILEQVLTWITGSDKDEDICSYMEAHMNDGDASELWDYFNEVIDWVKEVFVNYDKGMKSINWGKLYNEYHDEEFDPDEIDATLQELLEAKAEKRLDVSFAKIIEYCITRDETLLRPRAFSETQRTVLYNRQKGICPDCGQKFEKSKMHAHHIISWKNGGFTELDNGVMLCKDCHEKRHLTEG